MLRICEEFLRRILLLNISLVDKDDAGCHLSGKTHLVCNNDHGHARFGKLFHNFQNLSYHLRIECRSRFVKQHDIRIHRKGARDGDSLLLSAGKASRIGICFVRQSDTGQKLHRFFLCFFRCQF